MSKEISTKNFFSQEKVNNKFQEILGQKAKGFVTSVLQVVNSNNYLAKADPKTVYASAMIAATLDLNINNSLGYAYIVPYKGQAQFQIGYKGLIQLAQRTGEYKSINAIPIDESHLVSWNPLSEELEVDFNHEKSGKVVGYAARFELLNGFCKTVYWTKKEVEEHAKKYSQSYSYKSSPWNTNFDQMAIKTVLKKALSTYGIMSVEMVRANIADQGVISNFDTDNDTMDVDYVDNEPQTIEIQEKSKLDEEGMAQAKESIKMSISTLEEIQEEYDLTNEQKEELSKIK